METIPVHVDLGQDTGRIHLKCKWYQGANLDAKSIPGYRWDKENKIWHYPLTMDTCHMLRKVYGDRLVVGNGLTRWAQNAVRLEKEMGALGTALDAELKIVPESFPVMAEAMGNRKYQRAGAKFIATGRRVGVFDEVGLGKTITAIAGVVEGGKWKGDHLVVANKTALWTVWKDQIDMWTEGKAAVFVCDDTLAKRKATIQRYMDSDAESKWLVINPKMLEIKTADYCKKCKKFDKDMDKKGEDLEHFTMAHKSQQEVLIHKYPEFQTIPWNAVIVDEAHRILSTGVKSAKKAALTQVARGLLSLKEDKDVLRIALTGTPARGKELNLWGIMHWLWPTTYSSKWSWVDMYFEKDKDYMGHVLVGDIRPDMQERFWKTLDLHVLRRTRREVRADLPESESYTEWVAMSDKHLKQYTTFEQEGEVALDSGDTLIGLGVLSEMTRLRQMAFGVWERNGGSLTPTEDSPKLRRLMDMLEERGVMDGSRASENHYKYVVVSQFTQIIDMLEDVFAKQKLPTLKVTGAVTGRKRADAVRSFQEDPDGPRVLLMNTQAGGESITLDRYCDTMILLDDTFVADDTLQVYGRIDNRSVSAEEAVPRQFIHLMTKGTIEEAIAESNMTQLEIEHMLLDSRRGVELAKAFLRKEVTK